MPGDAGSDLERLLSDAAQGDREAFLEIYDRMAPRILGVIERILDDLPASEHVLEGVFAALWRESRPVSGSEASVAAWLAFRARSAALDRLARGTPSAPQRRDSAAGSGRTLPWLPHAEAIRRIDQRRPLLAKVLGQLPRGQFQALELVVFQGRAEAEVAGQLLEPLAKVKAELRAAARFLRHRRRAVVGSWAVNI
jgi:RNA polymerase sigma-70 factor, ECF subfamily